MLFVLTGRAFADWSFRTDSGTRAVGLLPRAAFATPGGPLSIYATGTAGLHTFSTTDGLLFAGPSGVMAGVVDADFVALPDGRTRMYYAQEQVSAPVDGRAHREIRSAISQDGTKWELEDGVRVADAGSGSLAAVALPAGGVRLYWTSDGPGLEDAILSSYAPDGLSFTQEAGERLPLPYGDPAVVSLSEGGWLMAVSTTGGELKRIFLARSSDGLNWTAEKEPTVALGKDAALSPVLLPLAAGRYRLYCSAVSPEGGPSRLLSGVVSRTAPKAVFKFAGRSRAVAARLAAVAVRLSVNEPVTANFTIFHGKALIGSQVVKLTGDDSAALGVALTKDGQRVLKRRKRVRVTVRVELTSDAGLVSRKSASGTLF